MRSKAKVVFNRIQKVQKENANGKWIENYIFCYNYLTKNLETDFSIVYQTEDKQKIIVPLLGHATGGKLGADKFFKPFIEIVFLMAHANTSVEVVEVYSLESDQSISINKKLATDFYQKSMGLNECNDLSFDLKNSLKSSSKSKTGERFTFSEYEGIYFRAINQRAQIAKRDGLIDELLTSFEGLFK